MVRAIQGLRVTAAAASLALGVQLFGSLATGPGADAHSGTVQATTRVHVRTQPTTNSKSLTILNPGAKVHASGTANGWTKVTWNGRVAYVYSKYLTTTRQPAAPVTSASASGRSRTTANLIVRSGPSIKHQRVALATKGTVVSLTGKRSGEYTQISWKGAPRWVATRYLTSPTTGAAPAPSASTRGTRMAQTTENLNVRMGPGTKHRRIATAKKGSLLPVTGRTHGEFTEVIYQGSKRWAASKWLRSVDASSTNPGNNAKLPSTTKRWATADLNIWYASSGSRYNHEIPKGSEIAITGKVANGRAEIVHKGALRWVTSRYTTSTAPSTPAPDAWSSSGTLPTTPITGGPRGKALNKGYSSGMHRTNPYIQRISADAWARFPQIKTHYGWRRDVTPDHPAGRAVDLMIPNYKKNNQLGWQVARYYQKYARELNIKYIIWDQKIWSVARSREGWRPMSNRGSDTANHYDHVHISSN
ncbi:SH3 domain-containing protein [uncultured Tessaracoccus sp.]|uniref:SH3 domain-containing protein n=1 Tax=uncultured Tessaracoccus sp. TaxID=905023 RepID=UPI00261783B4|nr:SH3 domain-containing protein [uncultured Tessaracoccus sp.]